MKPRGSIRKLLPFWLYVLIYRFGAGLHYALLSALGAQVFPVWVVGLLIGGAAFVQLMCDVPAGYLLDRFGYVRLLSVSTFFFILAAGTLLFGLTPVTYIITLILSVFGWLFYGPGANAYMLAEAPRGLAGKYMGLFSSVASAGIVLSSIALAFLITWQPTSIGIFLGAVLIVAFIAIRATPPETKSVHVERKVRHHTYYIRRTFLWKLVSQIRELNPASTLMLLQGFTGNLFYAVIWFTIPLVLLTGDHHGLWGISLSVFDLAVVVLGSWLGGIADRTNKKRLIFYGLLLFAIAGTVIGFHLNLWFLLLGFLATAGDEMSSVSLWAWLDGLDKKHEDDGLITGAISFFQDLGWTIGPIIAGLLFVQVGPAWAIAGSALPIFVTWMLSAFFFGTVSRATWKKLRWSRQVPRRPRHKN